MIKFNIPEITDDGLYCRNVGTWAIDKYKHVGMYASIFAKSMKNKWDKRVYIDLFSGPGYSKIEESGKIVHGSPIIALSVSHPFDRYIFCDLSKEAIDALSTRIKRDYSSADVKIICGDTNKCLEDIIKSIPPYGKNCKVLSFCFVDPHALSNLYFHTIEKLSHYFIDFLVLIPTGFEAVRFWSKYHKSKSETPLDIFLGTRKWREDWNNRPNRYQNFDAFLTEYYSKRMQELGYIYGGEDSSASIKHPGKKFRLYRLAFYSKNPLGEEFWNQTKKYSMKQIGLEF